MYIYIPWLDSISVPVGKPNLRSARSYNLFKYAPEVVIGGQVQRRSRSSLASALQVRNFAQIFDKCLDILANILAI
jgi:hypothetical protein